MKFLTLVSVFRYWIFFWVGRYKILPLYLYGAFTWTDAWFIFFPRSIKEARQWMIRSKGLMLNLVDTKNKLRKQDLVLLKKLLKLEPWGFSSKSECRCLFSCHYLFIAVLLADSIVYFPLCIFNGSSWKNYSWSREAFICIQSLGFSISWKALTLMGILPPCSDL